MNAHKRRPYPEGSRAARFLWIRDAILAHSHRMSDAFTGIKQLALGPFLIHYAVPGALGPFRPYNLAIWPCGREMFGHIIQANKVASVDWNQWDEVRIITFRSGEWEKELLDLLAAPTNISFMPRRKSDAAQFNRD